MVLLDCFAGLIPLGCCCGLKNIAEPESHGDEGSPSVAGIQDREFHSRG